MKATEGFSRKIAEDNARRIPTSRKHTFGQTAARRCKSDREKRDRGLASPSNNQRGFVAPPRKGITHKRHPPTKRVHEPQKPHAEAPLTARHPLGERARWPARPRAKVRRLRVAVASDSAAYRLSLGKVFAFRSKDRAGRGALCKSSRTSRRNRNRACRLVGFSPFNWETMPTAETARDRFTPSRQSRPRSR